MPEFARALKAVDDAVGPAYGIVAHSMGASASALAMVLLILLSLLVPILIRAVGRNADPEEA